MQDLQIALGYETLTGQLAGVFLGFTTLVCALLFARRYFENSLSQRIFVLAVGLRFVLMILSVSGLFNPPSADFAWFEIDAARIALGGQPWIVTIASADNFNAFQAALFYLLGASFYLADAIGLLGFAVSVVCLARFIKLLKLEEFEPWILLPFCFLPGSLLYLDYNTREVFQVLFLILMMHNIVRYRLIGGMMPIAKAAAFGYFFAVTHNKYIVVVPALIGIAVILPGMGRKNDAAWRRIFVLPFAIGLLLLANYITNSQGFLADVSDAGVLNYVSDLTSRASDLGARTQFPLLLTSASPAEFLLMLPVMMIQFICAPLAPFLVSAPVDILPAIDTAVRLVFLYGTWRMVRHAGAPPALRDTALLFLICYTVFCGITLLGTDNVGTQERHQIKIEWILFAAGMPYVASLFSHTAKARWRFVRKSPRLVRASHRWAG